MFRSEEELKHDYQDFDSTFPQHHFEQAVIRFETGQIMVNGNEDYEELKRAHNLYLRHHLQQITTKIQHLSAQIHKLLLDIKPKLLEYAISYRPEINPQLVLEKSAEYLFLESLIEKLNEFTDETNILLKDGLLGSLLTQTKQGASTWIKAILTILNNGGGRHVLLKIIALFESEGHEVKEVDYVTAIIEFINKYIDYQAVPANTSNNFKSIYQVFHAHISLVGSKEGSIFGTLCKLITLLIAIKKIEHNRQEFILRHEEYLVTESSNERVKRSRVNEIQWRSSLSTEQAQEILSRSSREMILHLQNSNEEKDEEKKADHSKYLYYSTFSFSQILLLNELMPTKISSKASNALLKLIECALNYTAQFSSLPTEVRLLKIEEISLALRELSTEVVLTPLARSYVQTVFKLLEEEGIYLFWLSQIHFDGHNLLRPHAIKPVYDYRLHDTTCLIRLPELYPNAGLNGLLNVDGPRKGVIYPAVLSPSAEAALEKFYDQTLLDPVSNHFSCLITKHMDMHDQKDPSINIKSTTVQYKIYEKNNKVYLHTIVGGLRAQIPALGIIGYRLNGCYESLTVFDARQKEICYVSTNSPHIHRILSSYDKPGSINFFIAWFVDSAIEEYLLHDTPLILADLLRTFQFNIEPSHFLRAINLFFRFENWIPKKRASDILVVLFRYFRLTDFNQNEISQQFIEKQFNKIITRLITSPGDIDEPALIYIIQMARHYGFTRFDLPSLREKVLAMYFGSDEENVPNLPELSWRLVNFILDAIAYDNRTQASVIEHVNYIGGDWIMRAINHENSVKRNYFIIYVFMSLPTNVVRSYSAEVRDALAQYCLRKYSIGLLDYRRWLINLLRLDNSQARRVLHKTCFSILLEEEKTDYFKFILNISEDELALIVKQFLMGFLIRTINNFTAHPEAQIAIVKNIVSIMTALRKLPLDELDEQIRSIPTIMHEEKIEPNAFSQTLSQLVIDTKREHWAVASIADWVQFVETLIELGLPINFNLHVEDGKTIFHLYIAEYISKPSQIEGRLFSILRRANVTANPFLIARDNKSVLDLVIHSLTKRSAFGFFNELLDVGSKLRERVRRAFPALEEKKDDENEFDHSLELP